MALRRFKLGTREIDLDNREVRDSSGGVAALTANEVGLLTVLADQSGQVVDRQQLLVEGLGYRKALQTRAIDQAIWRLRKKIEDEPERPVHLRSEQNVGYWLVLSPDRGVHLAGRRAELATLDRWLDEVSEVWVVGPPGIGRHTLAGRIEPTRGKVHIATRMPEDPAQRVLRLGLLSDEDAAELFVDRVLARRGTTALGAGEAAAVAELVREVGGWPAALGALADQAVIHTLPELARLRPLPVTVLPALVDFVRSWPEPIRAVAAAVAVCPHPIPAADLAETVGADRVVAAWRACAVEAVHRDGGRWFGVPAPMRRALEVAGVAAESAVAAHLIAQLVTTAKGLCRAVFDTGSAEARWALLAREPLTRWLLEHTRDPKLLEVLLVTPAPHMGPSPLPALPDPGDDVDALVARELLLSDAARNTDPVGANDRVLAAARHRPSAGVERWLAQRVAAALFRNNTDWAELDAAVERVRAACDASAHPHTRAVHLVARAMASTRRDRLDEASADLVEALRLEESQEGAQRGASIRGNLAALALGDGRCAEGVAWLEPVIDGVTADLAARGEANRRQLFGQLLYNVGRTDDAERQFDLVEALLGKRPEVEVHRAVMALLAGRTARAEVLLRPYLGVRVSPGGQPEMLMAWTRLLRRDGADAWQWFTRGEQRFDGDPWPFRLTRIVVAAGAGRVDDAARFLAEAPAEGRRWWPRGRVVAAQWVRRARGEAPDLAAIDAVGPPDVGTALLTLARAGLAD